MSKKIGGLIVMWLGIIVAYIILAAAFPAFNEIIVSTNATLAASGNMTHYPGTQATVETAPLWIWFIPGGIGFVASAIMLKKPDR